MEDAEAIAVQITVQVGVATEVVVVEMIAVAAATELEELLDPAAVVHMVVALHGVMGVDQVVTEAIKCTVVRATETAVQVRISESRVGIRSAFNLLRKTFTDQRRLCAAGMA